MSKNLYPICFQLLMIRLSKIFFNYYCFKWTVELALIVIILFLVSFHRDKTLHLSSSVDDYPNIELLKIQIMFDS